MIYEGVFLTLIGIFFRYFEVKYIYKNTFAGAKVIFNVSPQ